MSSLPCPSPNADARSHPDDKGTYATRPVVLVIDDEDSVRESLRMILKDEFEVLEAPDGAAALDIVRTRRIDVALLDVRMPGEPGPAILPRMLALGESIAVILMTAVPQVRTAVDAMKAGAYDYVIKPFDPDEILLLVRQAAQNRMLEREVQYLRSELDRAHGFDELVGRHPRMLRLYEMIAQVAPTPATVLITAESGTGKELVARALHRQSERRDQPFVAVNLAAIPDTLIESELFGHEKGAFTGAHTRKPGKFELAHGGTLFLDEVGSMRIDLQAKLLRALQQREIERLGATRPTPVDVRVVAATNQDLRQAVRERTFREDLFYRLNVVPLTVPPLRERKEDIALLVEHFIKKYSREFKKDIRGLSPSALPELEAYDWPGNVRELENVIERSVALATSPVIRLEDLPLDLAIHEVGTSRAVGEPSLLSLKEARERFEQAYVLRALEREDWNQSRAARILGVPPQHADCAPVGVGHPTARPRRPGATGDGRGAARARLLDRWRRADMSRAPLVGSMRYRLGAWLVAGLVAGCTSAPAVPPGTTDVSGSWEGTWNGGTVGRGRITMDLQQEGTRVTGRLAMTGVTAISATDGRVEGQVADGRLRFEQPNGLMEGEVAVSGDEMTGYATGRLRAGLALRRQPKP